MIQITNPASVGESYVTSFVYIWLWTVIHPLTQQDKMFWILEEQDNTKLSSDFESDISNNTYLARLWKLEIFQCLYELIKRLSTQPSNKFWKSLIMTQKFTKQTNNKTSETISKQYSFISYTKMITFWMFSETFKTCC